MGILDKDKKKCRRCGGTGQLSTLANIPKMCYDCSGAGFNYTKQKETEDDYDDQ